MTENTCERAPDLIAFLYNEMDERETLSFRRHLQECGQCREEAAELGVVRESIGAWRDEALAGFVSTPVTTTTQTKPNKSAIAAVRQFFDLSPLWLKGATAFALVAICALVGLAVLKLRTNSVPAESNAKYTEQDVNDRVNEALAKQTPVTKPVETQTPTVVVTAKPKQSKVTQVAKSRRPLSRAEREQLAADLRLLSAPDDTLPLLGDRINQ